MVWNRNLKSQLGKQGEKCCRNLKHILTSTIKIHVQSLGLYSSAYGSGEAQANPATSFFPLLATNTTSAPKSIGFITECINLGAMLTLLAQVGSGKERQSCLSATYTRCCLFFSPHCKSYSTPEHLDLSSQHTASRLVGFARARGCSQGWTKANPWSCSRNPSPPQIPSSRFPVLPLKAGAYFTAWSCRICREPEVTKPTLIWPREKYQKWKARVRNL